MFILDKKTRFYKNCKSRRKNKAKICNECPFRGWIEEQEKTKEAETEIKFQMGGSKAVEAAISKIQNERKQTRETLCKRLEYNLCIVINPADETKLDDIMDSLDLVEFIMCLEDDLDIELPDSDCKGWKTIGDVLDTVLEKSQS